MESKRPTIKEWKEKCDILERALEQSRGVLHNAGEEIKRQNQTIEEQKTTIKVLGGMVGGVR